MDPNRTTRLASPPSRPTSPVYPRGNTPTLSLPSSTTNDTTTTLDPPWARYTDNPPSSLPRLDPAAASRSQARSYTNRLVLLARIPVQKVPGGGGEDLVTRHRPPVSHRFVFFHRCGGCGSTRGAADPDGGWLVEGEERGGFAAGGEGVVGVAGVGGGEGVVTVVETEGVSVGGVLEIEEHASPGTPDPAFSYCARATGTDGVSEVQCECRRCGVGGGEGEGEGRGSDLGLLSQDDGAHDRAPQLGVEEVEDRSCYGGSIVTENAVFVA